MTYAEYKKKFGIQDSKPESETKPKAEPAKPKEEPKPEQPKTDK